MNKACNYLFRLNLSLGGFPVLSGELEGDALDSVYIYGRLDLGAVSRFVCVMFIFIFMSICV
jgi:hypothetical protein